MIGPLGDAVRQQLIEHEGLRLRVYSDRRGVLTIGVGRNLESRGLTLEEAQALLDHDIDECLADLQAFGWFGTLDAERLKACIDLRFNLGPGAFRTFRKFLSAMERQDYQSAAAELEHSVWAHQVQPARRDRIVRQIRDGKP